MDPITVAMFASSVIGALGSKKKRFKYKPYGSWLAMKDDVMKGIRKGIEDGGYTWSEEIGEKLQREALLDISKTYEGTQRRAVENLIPYGNIGAAGRASEGVAIARGQEESSALRQFDIARETQKLSSLQSLLQMGSGMSDPMLPGAAGQFNQQPSNIPGQIATGFEQGLSGYMFRKDAGEERDFWRNFLNKSSGSGGGSSIGFTGIPSVTSSFTG